MNKKQTEQKNNTTSQEQVLEAMRSMEHFRPDAEEMKELYSRIEANCTLTQQDFDKLCPGPRIGENPEMANNLLNWVQRDTNDVQIDDALYEMTVDALQFGQAQDVLRTLLSWINRENRYDTLHRIIYKVDPGDVEAYLFIPELFEAMDKDKAEIDNERIDEYIEQALKFGACGKDIIPVIMDHFSEWIDDERAREMVHFVMPRHDYDAGEVMAEYDCFIEPLRSQVLDSLQHISAGHANYESVIEQLQGYPIFNHEPEKNTALVEHSELVEAAGAVAARGDRVLFKWFLDTFGNKVFEANAGMLYNKATPSRFTGFPAVSYRILLDHSIHPPDSHIDDVRQALERSGLLQEEDKSVLTIQSI